MKVVTDNKNYTDIAEAIREKGVEGSFKPAEMAEAVRSIEAGTIPTGGNYDVESIDNGDGTQTLMLTDVSGGITDGIVVKSRDANGWPTEIDFYGTIVYPHTFGGSVGWNNDRRDMINGPMTINWKNALERVMNGAWTYSGQTELHFPRNPIVFDAGAFFADDTWLKVLEIPGGGSFGRQCIRNRRGLKTCLLGSVGFPIISIADNTIFQNCAQTGLSITLYCKGSDADDFLTKCRTGATNATIIIKASEDTTYNGTAYAAGEIILTSEVSA